MAAAAEASLAPYVGIKKFKSELTEDLIFEILLRLPIKKLSQCKTVCKKWLRMISSPSFGFRQFQIGGFRRKRHPPLFVLCSLVTEAVFAPAYFTATRKLKRLPRIKLPYIKPWNGGIFPYGLLSYKVFSAGYGIYCLFEAFTDKVLLWNPTTKEHKVLPPSPYVPSSRVHVFFFGRVEYKDGIFSYKVGRITTKLTPNSIYTRDTGGHVSVTLELYSSETDLWKVIPDFEFGQYFRYSDSLLHCANLNGRAHWVFQSASAEDTYITTFDYQTELFGRIKAPSPPIIASGYDKLRCLVTTFHDKFLCLGLFRAIQGRMSYIDIWVMRKYGDEDSWTMKLTVGPIPDELEVLEFSSKLDGVFLRHTQHSHTELLFWNCKSPHNKRCYSMGNRTRPRYGYCISPDLQVVEQVESLVSIL